MYRTLSLLTVGFVASAASASPINVPNASFETGQYQPGFSYTLETFKGASPNAYGGLAVRNDSDEDVDDDPVTNEVGQQYVEVEANNGYSAQAGDGVGVTLAQLRSTGDLGTFDATLRYTLTVGLAVNSQFDANDRDAVLRFLADGVVVAERLIRVDALGTSLLTDQTLAFTPDASLAGKQISFAIGARIEDRRFNTKVFADNVRLDASPIPEPAALGVLGMMLAGAALRRRRGA